MKACVMVLAVMASAAAGLAADGTIVSMKSIVAGLPRGTRVSLEMRARYAVVQPTRGKGKEAGVTPVEQYQLASPDVLKWEFTAGSDGSTPAKSFNFHFDQPLAKAPEGMIAVVTFPTRYKITCPPETCRSRESSPEFGMMLLQQPDVVIPRCLQIRGTGGVTLGVHDDCEDFRKKGLTAVPSGK